MVFRWRFRTTVVV